MLRTPREQNRTKNSLFEIFLMYSPDMVELIDVFRSIKVTTSDVERMHKFKHIWWKHNLSVSILYLHIYISIIIYLY